MLVTKRKDSIKPWDMTKCVFFFQLISEKWPATILKIKVQKGGWCVGGSGSGSGVVGGGGVHSDATEEPFWFPKEPLSFFFFKERWRPF